MALTPETRHFYAGLLHLIPPFWGKPRIAALLQAMLNRVQTFEDVCWDVLDRYSIEGADTERLNVLGRIVGQPRFTSNDEVYRAVIRAKIRTNISRGLTEDLIEILQLLFADVFVVRVHSFSPATLVVQPATAIDEDLLAAALFLLPKSRAAGVQMHVAFSPGEAGDYDYGSLGVEFDDATDPGTYGPGFYDVRLL